MGVVSNSYVGLGWEGMEMVVDKHARQSQTKLVACQDVACQGSSQVGSEDTDDSGSHHLPGAQFWVEQSQNWLAFQGKL